MATAVSKRQGHSNVPSPYAPAPETQNISPAIDPCQTIPSTQYISPTIYTNQRLPDTPNNNIPYPLKNLISDLPPSQPALPRQPSPLPKTLLSSFSELEIPTDIDKSIIIPRRKKPRKAPTRGFTFYEKDKSSSYSTTFQSKTKIQKHSSPSGAIPSSNSCKYMVKGADYYFNLVMFMLSDDNKLGEIIRECKEREEALINGIRSL